MNYRKFLADELDRRIAKNPLYSLRAFARDLSISKTHLAEILRGKNQLSLELASKFIQKLNLERFDSEIFMDLVEVEIGGNDSIKLRAQKRLEARFINLKQLEPTEFFPISEWYFMPLMELLTLPLESHSAENLAQRLGLTTETVEQALIVLLQNNFISQEGSRYTVTQNSTNPIPSPVIRQYYHKTLDVAAKALEQQSSDNRDFSVITFTMSKRKMNLVKERIRQFRRELALEMANDHDKDAVYTLSLNLFESTLAKETL